MHLQATRRHGGRASTICSCSTLYLALQRQLLAAYAQAYNGRYPNTNLHNYKATCNKQSAFKASCPLEQAMPMTLRPAHPPYYCSSHLWPAAQQAGTRMCLYASFLQVHNMHKYRAPQCTSTCTNQVPPLLQSCQHSKGNFRSAEFLPSICQSGKI